MTLSDQIRELRELDTEDPGGWPPLAKILAAVGVALAIFAAGYYFKAKGQFEQLDSAERQELQLRQTFEQKQAKAANLKAYEEQLAQMEEILNSLLRQLPSETEIPELLQDVSQTALATGIEVDRFEPRPEIARDFYAEKPISLRMLGTFHQFGEFTSGVAALPRVVILTMNDISLQPEARGADISPSQGRLVLEGTVRTYRYADEAETPQQAAAAAGAGQ